MANECKVTWSVVVDKDPPMNAPITDNVFEQLGSVSTGDYTKGSVPASHTAANAIPLGTCAGNCGLFTFNNPSPTETVQILIGAANGPVFAEARPGFNSGVLPVPSAFAPYVKATGSIDVDISYTIWAR